MASTDTRFNLNPHHHVVKINGCPEKSEKHGENLVAQLKSISSSITALHIEEDTPSNTGGPFSVLTFLTSSL
jgi:hypothetical protein